MSIRNIIDIKIEEPHCHSVAGSGAHQGRVQDAGDHAAAQAEPDCESLNLAIILFYLFFALVFQHVEWLSLYIIMSMWWKKHFLE